MAQGAVYIPEGGNLCRQKFEMFLTVQHRGNFLNFRQSTDFQSHFPVHFNYFEWHIIPTSLYKYEGETRVTGVGK